ncbi:MAG: amidohydrolase family protein [Ilumatobacter sp.]
MIVDALVIAGENRFRPGHELSEHIDVARRVGIDGLVAAPGRPIDYHLGPANDALAAASATADIPVARLGRVDPLDGDRCLVEAARCLDELGCAGLFLHPGEEAFPVRVTGELAALAADRGVPLVIAAGVYALSEPLQLLDLASAYPQASIVMTSGGQINISGLGMIDAVFALERAPNLSVLTNGEYRQDFIEQLAADLDPTRVLAGSFAPYFDMDYERRRVSSARIEPDARDLIEGGNAVRLFGLREPTP